MAGRGQSKAFLKKMRKRFKLGEFRPKKRRKASTAKRRSRYGL